MTISLIHFDTVKLVIDLSGTYVFGLSGAMLAVRHRLDLFGIIVMAAAAATAGGAIRDMALGATPPMALQDLRYLGMALASAITAFFLHRFIERFDKPVMWLDALGLGLFAVVGSQKALDYGLSPAAACLIGVLTCVGGGVVRDILVSETPRVLREEIYAVAAIIGSIAYVTGIQYDFDPILTAIVGFTITVTVRILSVKLNLRIPRPR